MVFASIIFLFYFFPLFILLYAATLSAKNFVSYFRDSFWLSNFVILLSSIIFYFWGENNATAILLGIILLNYIWAFRLSPGGGTEETRKRGIIFCVAANLICLFIFKYATFTLSLVTKALGAGVDVPSISLPLGISFFIFQAMSYSIDVYRGTAGVSRSFVGFAAYIAMFPQLVAGPIVRYTDITEQLNSRTVTLEKFASGIERFIFGLAKKILIANHVAVFADAVFGMQPDRLTPGTAWVGIICYTLQIYFDFSGYSDMAIGMGRMLGFDFKENFRHPYTAISMQDFWRRWHISLSSWFRDYLYIPLGGSRKGSARTYFNLLVVFLLCGLWHGAAVNFILWGAYHGAFLIFERVSKLNFRSHPLVGRIYTLTAIIFGWALFRAENTQQFLFFLQSMLCISDINTSGAYIWLWFGLDVKIALAIGVILSFPVYDSFCEKARRVHGGGGVRIGTAAVLVGLLLICIPFIVESSYNPFIYFRF